MNLEDNKLKLLDDKGMLVLKAIPSKNKTFKIRIHILSDHHLASITESNVMSGI